MSETSNQVKQTWKVVEEFLRRNYSTVYRKGEKLNASQVEILHDAISLLILVWYDMTIDLDGYSERWIGPWLNTMVTLDLAELVKILKAADALLLSSAQSNVLGYDDFKHRLSVDFPTAGAIISPLKKRLVRWLLYSDPTSFYCLHECFSFSTRLNLPDLSGLEDEAHADYTANEERLRNHVEYTHEEREVIQAWFPAESSYHLFNDWHPKHGPGTSANLMSAKETVILESGRKRATSRWILRKYKTLGEDDRIRYLKKRLSSFSDGPCPPVEFQRESKVVFVPKAIDKLRTICAEPSTLMWYQQGFLRSIVMYIENNPLIKTRRGAFQSNLNRRISLDHQEYSRDLARLGSVDGSIATMDLSSASDSVAWRMVKEWTRGSALAAIALATRSLTCRIGTEKAIKNEKFAPMGSALCFPFECIIFCAIIECAIRSVGGRPEQSIYRVYGDDLIIEAKYAYAVMRRLVMNGFLVNTKKSFYDRGTHNFREACGGEYLDGIDVTPVRLSRKFSGFQRLNTFTPSKIADLIDLCNTSFDTLPSVRRRLIDALLELPTNLRPRFESPRPTKSSLIGEAYRPDYFPDDKLSYAVLDSDWVYPEGLVVWSYQATNHHLKSLARSNKPSQGFVHGSLSILKSFPAGEENDSIRYYEWWRARMVAGDKEINDPYQQTTIDLPGELRWKTNPTLERRLEALLYLKTKSHN